MQHNLTFYTVLTFSGFPKLCATTLHNFAGKSAGTFSGGKFVSNLKCGIFVTVVHLANREMSKIKVTF